MRQPANRGSSIKPGRLARRRGPTWLLACGLLNTACLAAAPAEPSTPRLHTSREGTFHVALYKSGVIPLEEPAKRISVGNPGIADILILRNRELYVVGKALGTTNVVLWDRNDLIADRFDVEVTHDLETLKVKLHELLPSENIKVHSAQERIILSGEASNIVKMKAAEELAYSFLPECVASESNVVVRDTTQGPPVVVQQGSGQARSGNQECKEGSVVNLIQVGGAQQVMLQVKVAEMARDAVKRFSSDFNFIFFGNSAKAGGVSGGATFPNALTPDNLEVPIFGNLDGQNSPIGPVVDIFQPDTPTIADKGLFLSYLTGEFFFQAALEASRRKGLAKILAEPTLTTLTGQEAKFLSGGEFPIPVSGDFNRVTVEFKEFGVGLNFLPVVLDSGRVSLKTNVSVSEISNANSVAINVPGTTSTFFIPSLTKRSAASTVELANGQTIGIAGLINENIREFVDKLPGLGDIPVLGGLFRSQEFLSGQTELVIFVTPNLARPISPQQVRLPTDSFVPPDDLEFYLLGRLDASRKAADQPEANPVERGLPQGAPEDGHFGHQL